MLEVLFWTSSLGYVLTGINYVLRTVCIMLVAWIGYASETVKLERTTTITFIVQFFNTAILLLLTNANLSEQPLTFGLNGGAYADFNSMWFRSVGNTLISTMIFNAIFPVIEFIGFWGLRFLFRILDNGCSCNKYKTKQTAIQPYMNIYLGPEYLMHYKYSTILNVVFVTMMYGLGMPFLFPLAAFALLILYFTEKTMLFYSYQMPPTYDQRLYENVLGKLAFAPLLFLWFGYWMVSSRQLLSNDSLF